MRTLCVSLVLAAAVAANAQPFPTDQQVSSPLHYIQGNVCGLPSSVAYSEFLVASGAFKGDRCLVIPTGTNGWQLNGAAFSARIDANNNEYSKAFGIYGSAEVFGKVGRFAEGGGAYLRVEAATPNVWATAIHGECRSRTWGKGLCMGLNLELRGDPRRPTTTPDEQTYVGINVQPGEDQTGVVGLQFQHPQAYAHSIDLAGTCVKVGEVDGVGFYIGFGGRSQLMEFWRGGCRTPGATRHGYVNMNWGTPDVQLNR